MPEERLVIEVTAKGARVVAGQIKDIGEESKKSGKEVGLLRRGLGLIGGAALIRTLGRLSDQFTNTQNRIRLVTDNSTQLRNVMIELRDIAKDTRSSFDATAEIFSRVALNAEDLGRSNREVLTLTENLNKAVLLSGASSQEASAALIQLSQGLASGAVRGEELRSVSEQLPFILDQIGESIGKTRPEIIKMGRDGQLTTDIFFNVFGRAIDTLDEKVKDTVPTIGQAFNNLRTELLFFVGDANEASGAAEGIAIAIQGIADIFPRVVGGFADIATSLGIISRIQFDALTFQFGSFDELLTRIRSDAAAIKDLFTGEGGAFGPRAGSTGEVGGEGRTPIPFNTGGGKSEAEKALEAFDKMVASLEEQNRLATAVGQEEQRRATINNEIFKLQEAGVTVTEDMKNELFGALFAADMFANQSGVRENLIPDMEALEQQLATINGLYATGAISAEVFNEEVRRIELAKKPLNDVEQFGRQAFQSLQTGIVDTFLNGEDAARRFAQTVLAQFAQLAFTKTLFGAFPGLADSRIFGRQFGGPVPVGGTALVGENGPERVTFPAGGRVDPIVEQPQAPTVNLFQVRSEEEAVAVISSQPGTAELLNVIAANAGDFNEALGRDQE